MLREKQLDVASLIGVTRQTISNWVSKRRRGDKYAVTGKSRGRKIGDKRIINKMMGKKIQDYINNSRPEDHNIKSALWSRKSINALIKKYGGFFLLLSTIGEYFKKMGIYCIKTKEISL